MSRMAEHPEGVKTLTDSHPLPQFHYDRPSAHHYRERERELVRGGLVPVRDLLHPTLKELLKRYRGER